jgi:hypothetical protein
MKLKRIILPGSVAGEDVAASYKYRVGKDTDAPSTLAKLRDKTVAKNSVVFMLIF